VADQPLRTLALEREAFLVAIASNSMSSTAADALVDQRLIKTPLPTLLEAAPDRCTVTSRACHPQTGRS
jgi:hypothetical protein